MEGAETGCADSRRAGLQWWGHVGDDVHGAVPPVLSCLLPCAALAGMPQYSPIFYFESLGDFS